jgi:hypothetical protein
MNRTELQSAIAARYPDAVIGYIPDLSTDGRPSQQNIPGVREYTVSIMDPIGTARAQIRSYKIAVTNLNEADETARVMGFDPNEGQTRIELFEQLLSEEINRIHSNGTIVAAWYEGQNYVTPSRLVGATLSSDHSTIQRVYYLDSNDQLAYYSVV